MFWAVFDPANVPTPIESCPLLSYIRGSPFSKLWGLVNSIISFIWSTPPLIFFNLPSKIISLCLGTTTGFKIAPEPFPPDIVTERTFSTSNSCWSTKTSSIDPLTTGCTSAVVPVPGDGTLIVGGFITSNPFPWFNILNSDSGPKNILSKDL